MRRLGEQPSREQAGLAGDEGGGGEPRSCAATAGHHGSRSVRTVATHVRHAVFPGRTRGPTSAPEQVATIGRCRRSSAISRAVTRGSSTWEATTIRGA
ncbi:MAG: hypothetical protein CMH38_04550 [Microbacterium sp.]|nr:hypothetical protein [Microbacterium sp.]HBS75357.1 hypothetical protein [Microbacterium sp.]